MEALEYRIDNFVVLELRGRVDEFNTHVLRDEIHTIVNTGRFRIAIDLGKTEFLSAHCLRAVWKCQQRAVRVGGDIVFIEATGQVSETLKYVQLSRVMHLLPTLEDARQHFALQASSKNNGPEAGLGGASGRTGLGAMLRRFLQFVLIFGLCWFSQHRLQSTKALASEKRYGLDELISLARTRGSANELIELQKQEKVLDVDMVKSQQLPQVLLTTGYLYQSNPNLLTQLANRQLNQLRQQGAESDLSSVQSNTNFKIEKDVVVVSAGVLQAIYTGGLYEAQLSLAESRASEHEAKGRSLRQESEETVRKLYWGIVLLKRKLHLLEATTQSARAKTAAMRLATQQRVLSEHSLAEAELSELQALKAELEARQELKKLVENLNRAIGREPEETLELSEEPFEPLRKIHDPSEYLKIAENRYPELGFASARVRTARAYQESLRASSVRSPKAFLLGSVDHSRGLSDDTRFVNWTLGVAVSIPLYDGGRSFAEMEKSRLLLDQARLGFVETRRQLFLDIREAVAQLREAELSIEIAEKTLTIAQGRAHAASAALAKGQIPAYRARESEIGALQASIAKIAAESDYLIWKARLQSLVGEENL